jgi:hypothetical protein
VRQRAVLAVDLQQHYWDATMSEIVVNDELAQAIAASDSPVGLRNRAGHYLGYVFRSAFSPSEIVEAEQLAGSSGPWSTTQQVLDGLRAAESP